MDISNQILEAVANAKEQAKSAEDKFGFSAEMINIKSSSSIDLFGGRATSQVADIAAMTREACDELYATYQMLVAKIDMECRPLLALNPDVNAVCEVAETIKWLNKESAISTNFTGSINGGARADLVGVRYVPSIENKTIEKFWESKLSEMPGAYTARKAYEQKQIDERRAAKEAERKQKQALEEYEKRKAEEERQARISRFAENAAVVEARREHLQTAQTLIGCSSSAHAYITPDGKAHVECKDKFMFGDYEAYRFAFESGIYKSVVCTYSAVIGLRKNGTCAVAHGKKPIDAKSDKYVTVKSWTRIKKLVAGFDHVVGLRDDGTCVCSNLRAGSFYGSSDVDLSDWRDIQDVACGTDFVIGLRTDGTVLHRGGDSNTSVRDERGRIVKELPSVYDCEKWKDIALIGAGHKSVYGVTKSGEILWVGEHELPEESAKAENIVQITVAGGEPYFLQADGKVYGKRSFYDFGCSGEALAENVVAMAPGYILLLLKENGELDYYKIGHDYIAGSSSVKLFDSYEYYIAEMKAAAEAEQKKLQQQASYRQAGVCQHCGGAFKKSLFSCKCTQCGMKKDY